MLKDKFIVIIVGLFIGGIIAFGVFIFQNYFSDSPKVNTTIIETPIAEKKPTITNAEKISEDIFAVSSPEDNFQTTSTTVAVSGKTKPNRQILVSGNVEEQTVTSSSDGTFSLTIKLEDGGNEIKIIPLDNVEIAKTKIVMKTFTLTP